MVERVFVIMLLTVLHSFSKEGPLFTEAWDTGGGLSNKNGVNQILHKRNVPDVRSNAFIRLMNTIQDRASNVANMHRPNTSRAKFEPESETEPELKLKPEPKSRLKSELVIEPETEPEFKPEPKLESESRSEPEPRRKIKYKPESEPRPEPELRPKPEPKLESESEVKSAPELEHIPEPKLKPEFTSRPEVESERELKTEPEKKHKSKDVARRKSATYSLFNEFMFSITRRGARRFRSRDNTRTRSKDNKTPGAEVAINIQVGNQARESHNTSGKEEPEATGKKQRRTRKTNNSILGLNTVNGGDIIKKRVEERSRQIETLSSFGGGSFIPKGLSRNVHRVQAEEGTFIKQLRTGVGNLFSPRFSDNIRRRSNMIKVSVFANLRRLFERSASRPSTNPGGSLPRRSPGAEKPVSKRSKDEVKSISRRSDYPGDNDDSSDMAFEVTYEDEPDDTGAGVSTEKSILQSKEGPPIIFKKTNYELNLPYIELTHIPVNVDRSEVQAYGADIPRVANGACDYLRDALDNRVDNIPAQLEKIGMNEHSVHLNDCGIEDDNDEEEDNLFGDSKLADSKNVQKRSNSTKADKKKRFLSKVLKRHRFPTRKFNSVQPQLKRLSPGGPVRPQSKRQSPGGPVRPQSKRQSPGGPVRPQSKRQSPGGPVRPQSKRQSPGGPVRPQSKRQSPGGPVRPQSKRQSPGGPVPAKTDSIRSARVPASKILISRKSDSMSLVSGNLKSKRFVSKRSDSSNSIARTANTSKRAAFRNSYFKKPVDRTSDTAERSLSRNPDLRDTIFRRLDNHRRAVSRNLDSSGSIARTLDAPNRSFSRTLVESSPSISNSSDNSTTDFSKTPESNRSVSNSSETSKRDISINPEFSWSISHVLDNSRRAISRTPGSSRSISHTLDNPRRAISKTLGSSRSISHTLDNSRRAISRTPGSSRSISHTLDNPRRAISKTLGYSRSISHTLDNSRRAISRTPGSSRSISHTLDNPRRAISKTLGSSRSISHTLDNPRRAISKTLGSNRPIYKALDSSKRAILRTPGLHRHILSSLASSGRALSRAPGSSRSIANALDSSNRVISRAPGLGRSIASSLDGSKRAISRKPASSMSGSNKAGLPEYNSRQYFSSYRRAPRRRYKKDRTFRRGFLGEGKRHSLVESNEIPKSSASKRLVSWNGPNKGLGQGNGRTSSLLGKANRENGLLSHPGAQKSAKLTDFSHNKHEYRTVERDDEDPDSDEELPNFDLSNVLFNVDKSEVQAYGADVRPIKKKQNNCDFLKGLNNNEQALSPVEVEVIHSKHHMNGKTTCPLDENDIKKSLGSKDDSKFYNIASFGSLSPRYEENFMNVYGKKKQGHSNEQLNDVFKQVESEVLGMDEEPWDYQKGLLKNYSKAQVDEIFKKLYFEIFDIEEHASPKPTIHYGNDLSPSQDSVFEKVELADDDLEGEDEEPEAYKSLEECTSKAECLRFLDRIRAKQKSKNQGRQQADRLYNVADTADLYQNGVMPDLNTGLGHGKPAAVDSNAEQQGEISFYINPDCFGNITGMKNLNLNDIQRNRMNCENNQLAAKMKDIQKADSIHGDKIFENVSKAAFLARNQLEGITTKPVLSTARKFPNTKPEAQPSYVKAAKSRIDDAGSLVKKKPPSSHVDQSDSHDGKTAPRPGKTDSHGGKVNSRVNQAESRLNKANAHASKACSHADETDSHACKVDSHAEAEDIPKESIRLQKKKKKPKPSQNALESRLTTPAEDDHTLPSPVTENHMESHDKAKDSHDAPEASHISNVSNGDASDQRKVSHVKISIEANIQPEYKQSSSGGGTETKEGKKGVNIDAKCDIKVGKRDSDTAECVPKRIIKKDSKNVQIRDLGKDDIIMIDEVENRKNAQYQPQIIVIKDGSPNRGEIET